MPQFKILYRFNLVSVAIATLFDQFDDSLAIPSQTSLGKLLREYFHYMKAKEISRKEYNTPISSSLIIK